MHKPLFPLFYIYYFEKLIAWAYISVLLTFNIQNTATTELKNNKKTQRRGSFRLSVIRLGSLMVKINNWFYRKRVKYPLQ
jgi:hypothetical protein